jgi:hypothetical protein
MEEKEAVMVLRPVVLVMVVVELAQVRRVKTVIA